MKFIYLFVFALLSVGVFCQSKISDAEYKVYNAVLKQIFVQRGFEVEHLPKEHTVLNVNEHTVNRVLGTPF
ncbi:MAG TPA: hypothetical protein VN698_05530, partial [Bacteroidia bacterium]|nr:hypothetical protein [Bacteroidia bacterium]